MAIPAEVIKLITEEQKRLGNIFAPEDRAYFEKLENHAELVTHQTDNELLGFVFFYCNDKNKQISYISLIATSPKARGTGIGYGLLNYVLQIAKQRGFACCQLEVHKNNAVAYKFYSQAGFKIVEDRGERYLLSAAIT